MARPKVHLTPEAALEAARAKSRRGVARHKEKMDRLTRLEQGAWKARASLGEGYNPYTEAEREEAEAIRAETERLIRRAERLNARLRQRLTERAAEPGVASLLGALDGRHTRLDLAPY